MTLHFQGEQREVAGMYTSSSSFDLETRWQVPPASEGLVVVQGDGIVLRASQNACFRRLEASYAATGTVPTGDPNAAEFMDSLPMFDGNMAPAVNEMVLDGLPDGDWVVRVKARFDSLSGDTETVQYFRILSGSGPFVTDAPTPARPPRNSPAVPCGALQPTADIGVHLFVGSQISIPGSIGVRSTPAEVRASAADPIQIRIDGDTCAVGWNIELTNVEGGGITPVSRFSDPADDPAYAAQNRWSIASAFGRQIVILTASLHFRDGLDVVRTWQIMLEPFVVPSLYLVGHDGIRFEASFGCGLFLDLRDGYQSSEECVSIGYRPGPDALYIAPYEVIHLDLPGWQLTSWSANCGTVTSGDTEQFEAPGGCGLGGGSSDDGGPLEDPPAFVLPAGDTVISIGIGAIDDALNQFNVIYYAHVIAR